MTVRLQSGLLCLLLSFLWACGALKQPIESIANSKAADRSEVAQLLKNCPDCDQMRRLFVVDLHADTFLWGRDALRKSKIGHVDLVRLRTAGIDLQIFGVPSWTPRCDERPGFRKPEEGERRCTDKDKDRDTSSLLYAVTARGFGREPREIAFDQARSFCRVTGGITDQGEVRGAWDYDTGACTYPADLKPGTRYFYPIRTADDLIALRTAIARTRATAPDQPLPVGAILSIEGVHWIKKDADVKPQVAALKRAGFRIIGLTHKFTNDLWGLRRKLHRAR